MTSALTISTNYILQGTAKFKPGDYTTLHCNQLKRAVRIPNYGPLESLVRNLYPDLIELTFVESEPDPIILDVWCAGLLKPSRKTFNMNRAMPFLISPLVVEFFEVYQRWLQTKFRNRNHWPETWRFARAIRNSISHGGGKYLHDRNDPSVSWYGLTYDATCNGRQTVGGDLSAGDVVVLLFELSDELDSLGCSF